MHLKDASKDDAKKDVPFGEGILDWGAILSASKDAGVEFYLTEQDNPNPDDPMSDATIAYRNAEKAAQ